MLKENINMAKLTEIIKNDKTTDIVIKVNKVPVTIKTRLSSEDFVSCAKTIVENCTVEGVFHPEFKEITKRNAYLIYFTDIDISGYTADDIFLLTQSSWFEEIFKIITNTPVYYDIERTVDDLFNNRKTSFDKLCDTVSEAVSSGNEINFDEMKNLLNQLNKVDKKAFVNAVINKKRKK